MKVFCRLRSLRDFERAHLPFLESKLDFDLICEIGYRQERGSNITMKELFLADVGAISTIRRRLNRLRRLDVVRHLTHNGDGRVVELFLSPETLALYRRYAAVMTRS